MTSDEHRFPRSVYDGGEDPDARFSMANERTFLAWVRTSLAFVAGGLAVEALQPPIARSLRLVVAVLLLLAGLAAAAQAWRGWARTERAMRHHAPLPSSGLKLPIVVILGIVALAVLLGVLL
jgi:putative membrane protein